MSAASPLEQSDGVHIPSHELALSPDGERLRLSWWPRDGVRARALFRLATDDDVAVLANLSVYQVAQRKRLVPDWDATLEHVPNGLLLAMRGAGYTPAEEGDFA